jgi:hypothetical protein
VHATVEDRFHVGTEIAPGETQQDNECDDCEKETHLELLRFEHGIAQVEEHNYGDN